MAVFLSLPCDPLVWLVHHRTRADDPPPERIRELVRAWLDRFAHASRRTWPDALADAVDVVFGPAVPPDPTTSRLHRRLGSGSAEEATLERANRVAVIVSGRGSPHAEPLHAAFAGLATARALASAVDGVVLDVQSGAVAPIGSRDEALPDGPIAWVHFLRLFEERQARGRCVATTGLASLGLPDLEVGQVPPPLVPAAKRLLLQLASSLSDRIAREPEGFTLGPFLPSKAAAADGCEVELSFVGPPEERLVRVHPPGAFDGPTRPMLAAFQRRIAPARAACGQSPTREP